MASRFGFLPHCMADKTHFHSLAWENRLKHWHANDVYNKSKIAAKLAAVRMRSELI